MQTDGDAIPTEQLIPDHASDESILRDLFLQAAALKLPRQRQRIMEYLIHSLDENGFLTEPADAVADILGASPDAVCRCIALLQGMEPAGIGAADLKECLRLQLIRQPPADPVALQIVEGYLSEMAKQQYGAIARALQVPRAQVLRSCERIRSLNPKPLNGEGGDTPTQYIIPDFYILEDGGQLRCIMNDYYLPRIRIDPSYHELIRKNNSPQRTASTSRTITGKRTKSSNSWNTASPPCSGSWNMSCRRRPAFSTTAPDTAQP